MERPSSTPLPHGKSRGLGASRSRQGCRIAGRLWVEKEGETFLAWGRIVLLQRVREHGSIAAAARSMGMGYRHAWMLIDQMNRLSPLPLVERTVGGRDGGGARVTPAGDAVITHFWDLVADLREWLGRQDPRLWKKDERRKTRPPRARRRMRRG